MARIAYQASDLIISVQPSLAVDSEFSSHLKRYSGRKERSLVAKNVEAVPEVRIFYLCGYRNKHVGMATGRKTDSLGDSSFPYDTMPTRYCPFSNRPGMAGW